MNASQVIAHELKRLGVRHAFGMPGGDALPLLDALLDVGIEFVLVRHEGSAGFMADAAAQLTGAPGVCISTLGPGMTNLVSGLSGCLLDRAPVVAITGQVSEQLVNVYTHQTLDQKAILASVVKRYVTLSEQNAWREVALTLRHLHLGRPGPVLLNLPGDVARAEQPAVFQENWPVQKPAGPVQPISGSRPVVLAGLAALQAGLDLDRLQMPVLTTYKGKGLIDERSPWYAGSFGLSTTADAVHKGLVEQADAVIAVGLDPVELRPQWLPGWPADTPVHVFDDDPPHDLTAAITTAQGLQNLSSVTPCTGWAEGEVAAHRAHWGPLFEEDSFGPATAIRAIQAGLPADAVVALDVGAHRITASHVWRSQRPNELLQSNGLSSMGYGLPAALAAKLSLPDRVCVSLTGDAGLWMAMGELGIAQERGLDLVCVFLADNSLALIEHKQRRMKLRRTGVRFENPDTLALAHAFGGIGHVCVNAEQATHAVRDAVAQGGLHLVEVRIDEEPYARQV